MGDASASILVPLTQGYEAVIDVADADLILPHRWCVSVGGNKSGHPVAVRAVRLLDGRQRLAFMHRVLMGLEHGDVREVDHRNFDSLDNRRANLRIVSGKANREHQPSREGSSSRFVGVTYDKQRGRWRAQIQVDGVVKNLGRFGTEVEAAEARDRTVRSLGTFHALNDRGC